MDPKYDLKYQIHNDWFVVRRAPSNKFQDAYWFCVCLKCGKQKRVKGSFIRRGVSKNCGCNRARIFKDQNQLAPGEGAVRQLMNTYKQMARFKQRPFELTLEQFKELTKGNCHYCGVPPCQTLTRKHNGGKTYGTPYQYNGVDRLDSSLGYTLENCVSACGVHNKMKLDMSAEDFLKACKAVVDYFKP
jgi:hypothetical protein